MQYYRVTVLLQVFLQYVKLFSKVTLEAEMVLCFWGIDLGTFQWVKAVIEINLDLDKPIQEYLERQSKMHWLIVPKGFCPAGESPENLDSALGTAIEAIAGIYPGIILYGAERFPGGDHEFQSSFWEDIGHIDSRMLELESIQRKLAAIEANRNAIPDSVQKLAHSYNGKMPKGLVKAKLKKYYPENFQDNIFKLT